MKANEAKRLANEHLRSEGPAAEARHARRDSVYGVYVVGYVDPTDPDTTLAGGALVVTDDGKVHDLSSAPGSLAELMMGLQPEGGELRGRASRGPQETALEETEFDRYTSGRAILPASWAQHLGDELNKEYWPELLRFVAQERGSHVVYPPASQTFAAFELTAYDDVRVVILGQDPYPNPCQAHGLAFSVPVSEPPPPSLQNIHAVLHSDKGVPPPTHGNLQAWGDEGVLLLNTVLTVRAGSRDDRQVHRRWRRREHKGWEAFTDAVITAINAKPEPVMFLLWGVDAGRKAKLVTTPQHKVLTSSHPSPLSAYRGFLTSRPFSEANTFLKEHDRGEIDWGSIGEEP